MATTDEAATPRLHESSKAKPTAPAPSCERAEQPDVVRETRLEECHLLIMHLSLLSPPFAIAVPIKKQRGRKLERAEEEARR